MALSSDSFLRFSSDDLNATIKAYAGDGEFTDDPYGMDGGIAVIRLAYRPTAPRQLPRQGEPEPPFGENFEFRYR